MCLSQNFFDVLLSPLLHTFLLYGTSSFPPLFLTHDSAVILRIYQHVERVGRPQSPSAHIYAPWVFSSYVLLVDMTSEAFNFCTMHLIVFPLPSAAWSSKLLEKECVFSMNTIPFCSLLVHVRFSLWSLSIPEWDISQLATFLTCLELTHVGEKMIEDTNTDTNTHWAYWHLFNLWIVSDTEWSF